MYLRRVEVHGFKSFADRTEIELSPGITAIVGPNGSGKSNLGDAIRWALGEQNAKTLRGTRMEDVIFAGSSVRRPLGFAEATLVFENGEGRLPIDFTEVAVTRRVYRSGESDFSICGVPCRLRDITALFMDTGAGREGYSIIEQGRLEAILAAGPGERGAFFEEAAGTHKYRSRRVHAGRKLALVDADMTRLADVVAELGRQMEPLEHKAGAARRFRELARELAEIEVGLALDELDAIERRRAELSRRAAELDARADEAAHLRESISATIGREREELSAAEEESDRAQARATHWAAEMERTEGRVAVGRERVRAHASRISAIQDALAKDGARHEAIVQELLSARSRLSEIEAELGRAGAELDSGLTEERDLEERARLHSEREARLRADVVQTLSEMAEVRNELARLTAEGTSDARRVDRLRREIASAEAETSEREASLAEAERTLAGCVLRASEVSSRRRELERELERARRALDGLVERYEAVTSHLREESRELAVYEGLASRDELLPRGARAVLAAARAGHLEGVLGSVGDTLRVPPELERAIEEALGQAVADIIVSSDAHARAAVRYLKERDLGRATFLPLDLIRPASVSREERAGLARDGVLGVASELVSCDAALAKAVEHLLGRTVVVRDLDVAVAVSRATATRLRVVTIDGEIVFPGGAIAGGGPGARRQAGMLSLRRRLDEAKQRVEALQGECAAAAAAVESARAEVAGLERELQRLRAEGQALELEAAKAEAAAAQVRRELDRTRARIRVLTEELEAGSGTDDARAARKRELEDRRAGLEALNRELEEDQARLAADGSAIARAREDVARAITAARVKLAALGQEAAGLRERIPTLASQARQVELDIRAAQVELERLEAESDSARDAVREAESRLEALRAEKADIEDAAARARERRRALARRVAQAEARLRSCQADIEALQRARAECSVEEAALAERARSVADALARANRALPDAALAEARVAAQPVQPVQPTRPVLDRAGAERRAHSLRREIEALGPVDPGVLEAYSSLADRRRILSDALDELRRARNVIQHAMDEADRSAEARFRETLQKVRVEFGRMFSRLFGGGSADLVMVEAEESGAPGVEIVVEPPGKRLQSLSLLSAGERALAAAALVFAILKVRPSPFCVLDEVDAALDEANVGRFVEVLKEAAMGSQLIVVTHRKGTMEAADVLYGVTMEESGVSKLVSVNLDEVAGRSEDGRHAHLERH